MRSQNFTVTYSGRARELRTSVKIAQPFDPRLTKEEPTFFEFSAIWDTGATNTVITSKIVQSVGLAPIRKAIIRGVNSIQETNMYLISLRLPNNVTILGLPVLESNSIAGNNVDLLVGMDVISQGDFAVTNYKGNTALSFRNPSQELIDFTGKVPRIIEPRVGRNEKCPCGSGKKYKNCCGKVA